MLSGVIASTRKRLEALIAAKQKEAAVSNERDIFVNYIKISANSLAELRKVDVDRVISSVRSDNIDGVTRESLGDYIKAGRPEFLVVTPGVRPAGAALDDQARIATPKDALSSGASHLVVGRPITAASDPRAAAQAIVREISAV